MFVAALAADLFVATRIESAIRAAGAEARTVDSGPALWDAIERWPELVLIDLSTPGWEEPVRRAKTLPQTRAIPIVAFGSHVDTALLAAARQAGCDHAWARSRFFEELPRLLKDSLHPATRFVAGWDEPPPAALAARRSSSSTPANTGSATRRSKRCGLPSPARCATCTRASCR